MLTEERFFHGDLAYLEQIHARVAVPLLRKDFMLDPYQIVEAKSFGADAVLFIAAMLDTQLMGELRQQASELQMDSLVEVHCETELEAALNAGAQLIGINNRDLKTFAVSLATTERLAPLVPAGMPAVCESGIDNIEQIRRVEELGIHTFLIGESLMRAPAPGKSKAVEPIVERLRVLRRCRSRSRFAALPISPTPRSRWSLARISWDLIFIRRARAVSRRIKPEK